MYNNIEAERVRYNYTKEKLAAELGITSKTYSAYINEVSPIPSDVLLRMARIFRCRTDYLLGLDDDITRPA